MGRRASLQVSRVAVTLNVDVRFQPFWTSPHGPVTLLRIWSGRLRQHMQKILIVTGLILVAIGIVWPWLRSTPLGRLPGDIVVERDSFTLYFPITTLIIISVLISVILWFFRQ